MSRPPDLDRVLPKVEKVEDKTLKNEEGCCKVE